MEQWDVLIERYPPAPTLRDFSRAVESAKVVLKEDLAPFEIDWVLQSLLKEPVGLLSSLSTHFSELEWSAVCGRSLELLSMLVVDHTGHLQGYLEDIVKTCTLHYASTHIRARALHTLTSLVQHTQTDVACVLTSATRTLTYADEPVTVRAVWAQVLGCICEHCPHQLSSDKELEIWRIYFAILEDQRPTDSLIYGVLVGLSGLFKYFGVNLPTAQLNTFYERLAARYLYINTRCQEASLKILANHASLFPERLAADAKLRRYLGSLVASEPSAADALARVYEVATNDDNVKGIVQYLASVVQASTTSPQERQHSSRILSRILHRYKNVGDFSEVQRYFDKEWSSICTRVEFALASKMDAVGSDESVWQYDHELTLLVQQASWCIESGLPGCESLLATLLPLYRRVATTHRRKYVLHTVLKAPPNIRTAAITFLISESCRCTDPDSPKTGNIDHYLPMWRDLFDSQRGKDKVVLEHSKAVFEGFINYILFVLDAYLEDNLSGDDEKIKEKLSSLLQFASQVLLLENVKDYATDYTEVLLHLTMDCLHRLDIDEAAIAFVKNLVEGADESCMFEDESVSVELKGRLKAFYESLAVSRCRSESILCAACLALMQAPTCLLQDAAGTLGALQVIFSRRDVEPATLSKALRNTEALIHWDSIATGDPVVSDIISRIDKLRSRKDLKGKDSKRLHRDVLLFMGKYGNRSEVNNNSEHNQLITSLRDVLTFNIPNPNDGTTYKINLQRILDLALLHEEPGALHSLLLMLCTNLSNRRDPLLQQALTAVILKLSHCHSRGELTDADSLSSAVAYCDSAECVRTFVMYISVERSPGVRQVLSTLLETLLVKDARADNTENFISVVLEQASFMMDSHSAVTKRAGLDLVECIISVLKEENSLTIKHLPNLLLSILKTNEDTFQRAYEIANKHYEEKFVLFENKSLDFAAQLLETALSVEYVKTNLPSAVKLSMATLKIVFTKHDNTKFLDMFLKAFEKVVNDDKALKYLLILSEAKTVLNFDTDMCRKVVAMKDFYMLSCIKDIADKVKDDGMALELEVIYEAMREYAEVLFEVKYVDTVQHLSTTISVTTPEYVKKLHNIIESCIKVYQKLWKNTPQKITTAFVNWFKKLPVAKITQNIQKKIFSSENAVVVYAMRKMLRTMNVEYVKNILLETNDQVTKWQKILLHFFASGYVSEFLKPKMAHLTDVLAVTFYFLNRDEVKATMLETGVASEKIGLKFSQCFIGAFAPYFVKSGVLLDNDMAGYCAVIHDVIKFYGKQNCDEEMRQRLADLLDKLWPTLQSLPFQNLASILSDFSAIDTNSLPLSSAPGRWVVGAMTLAGADGNVTGVDGNATGADGNDTGADGNVTGAAGNATGADEMVKLMSVLPVVLNDVDDEMRGAYNEALKAYASLLPSRLSELNLDPPRANPGVVQALLSALAATGDEMLLDLMMTTFAFDAAPGWWDGALATCIAELARQHASRALLDAVYRRCDKNEYSVALCDRVLLPLLRHSPPAVTGQFLPACARDALATLWRKQRTRIVVAAQARALYVIMAAFEQLPLSELESPSSALNTQLSLKKSAKLSQETCKLCVALRTEHACPSDASDEVKKTYRDFHTANFNCLASVFCKTRPNVKLLSTLFEEVVWNSIVDCERTYVLYIEPAGRTSNKRHLVSCSDNNPDSLTLTRRNSPFTRRTLSDNPRLYDFLQTEGEITTTTTAIVLSDNPLNSHPCAPSLSAVVTQWCAEWQPWLVALVHCLRTARTNARWLLAQVIVNCKTELRPHSAKLTPSLLELVASTPYQRDGVELLNGLHVHILNTIAFWADPAEQLETEHVQNLNKSVQLLLNTCIHHKKRYSVFKAAVNTLTSVLQVCGRLVVVEWTVFEEYLKDTTNESPCLEMLLSLTRHKASVPGLVPAILTRFDAKQIVANKFSNMAELLGCAMDTANLSRFWKVLDRLRLSNSQEYVKVLFYAQKGCAECCNEINFRHIADLAPKMVREQKAKCYEIISTYIARFDSRNEHITDMFDTLDICEAVVSEHTYLAMRMVAHGLHLMSEALRRRAVFLISDYCNIPVVKTREVAFEVIVKAFCDIFTTTTAEPSAKRQKTHTSHLLSLASEEDIYIRTVTARVGEGMVDREEGIRRMVRGKVVGFLSEDVSVRFAEISLILFCPPLTTSTTTLRPPLDVATTLTVFVELLLSNLRGEVFRKILLREEALAIAGPLTSGPSKLLTMSRTFQGTFKTPFTVAGRRRTKPKSAVNASGLNVQVPLNDIFESFMKFSQSNASAATALYTSLLKCLQRGTAELNTLLAQQLGTAVERSGLSELTVVLLETCRLCVDECTEIQGFKESIEKVKATTAGTEGEPIVRLLYEDVLLRDGNEQFVLGNNADDDYDEEMTDETLEFSMEDLTSAFGKLSNWDDLTLQKRRRAIREQPILWTDHNRFRTAIDSYEECPGWLSKMASSLRDRNNTGAHYTWLRELDTWPRRAFNISAITEAIEWQSVVCEADIKRLPHDIPSSECMAEWTARLMTRSAFLTELAIENESEHLQSVYSRLSRAHELAWCERASEHELSELVLQCVERNQHDLHEGEVLPWLRQQAMALRAMGLRRNSEGLLHKALRKVDVDAVLFREQASPDAVVAMNTIKLLLHRDLNTLTDDSIEIVLKDTDEQTEQLRTQLMYSKSCRQNTLSILETAMCHYDQYWNEQDVTAQDASLSAMAASLRRLSGVSSLREYIDAFVCVLLNRLAQYCGMELGGTLAEGILEQFDTLTETSNDFILDALRRLKHLFPTDILRKHTRVHDKLNTNADNRYRRCLELLCDPEYALIQYCEGLGKCLGENDGDEWQPIFDRMMCLLQNPYAGPAFTLLSKYTAGLDDIRTFEYSKQYHAKARQTIKEVLYQLSRSDARDALNLSELCPALARYTHAEDRDGRCLNKVLNLGDTVEIVRFEKQIQVITNSLRRPCVVRVLLGDGKTRRFLVKRGEPLRADAAVGVFQTQLNARSGCKARSYHVTPLSDDCGVIEYLGDHVTVRNMIAAHYDLDAISSSVRRAADADLILASPAVAMSQYRELCQKIPCYALSSAMESSSASVQDFIQKKRVFLDTLSAMTIYHWLLGIGDRHTENLLYSSLDGAVCAVDWAAIFQHGGSNVPELMPARLTRQLLAVVDPSVLETRLQGMLSSLRECRTLIVAVTRVLFQWVPGYSGDGFQDKLHFIERILSGTTLPHHITKQVIASAGTIRHGESYVLLLESVFEGWGVKERYGVEEQVSCLLRQCTEPRLLCVTRRGWEPWL